MTNATRKQRNGIGPTSLRKNAMRMGSQASSTPPSRHKRQASRDNADVEDTPIPDKSGEAYGAATPLPAPQPPLLQEASQSVLTPMKQPARPQDARGTSAVATLGTKVLEVVGAQGPRPPDHLHDPGNAPVLTTIGTKVPDTVGAQGPRIPDHCQDGASARAAAVPQPVPQSQPTPLGTNLLEAVGVQGPGWNDQAASLRNVSGPQGGTASAYGPA